MYANDPGYEPTLPIFRCAGAGSYRFLALQRSLHGVKQHWCGQSLPCPGEHCCPFCREGMHPRFVGYIVVALPTNEKRILEVPHSSHGPFRTAEQNGALFRHVINVTKGNDKSAWRIEIEETQLAIATQEISGEELLDALARIHSLPRRRSFVDVALWREALERAAIARLTIALGRETSKASS